MEHSDFWSIGITSQALPPGLGSKLSFGGNGANYGTLRREKLEKMGTIRHASKVFDICGFEYSFMFGEEYCPDLIWIHQNHWLDLVYKLCGAFHSALKQAFSLR